MSDMPVDLNRPVLTSMVLLQGEERWPVQTYHLCNIQDDGGDQHHTHQLLDLLIYCFLPIEADWRLHPLLAAQPDNHIHRDW